MIVSPVGAKCRLCAAVFLFVENCSTPGFVLQEGKIVVEAEYMQMPIFELMFDKL
jgi:hypothetical protein